MRSYLVVIDDSEESALAMRFAARRAARTGGQVHVLAIVPPHEFVAWGGAQATIEDEARARAEALVTSAAGTLVQENGVAPKISVMNGKDTDVVREVIASDPNTAALVLGAAASGNPGALVSHFAGSDAGKLGCPLMLIPGSMTIEDIDRLS